MNEEIKKLSIAFASSEEQLKKTIANGYGEEKESEHKEMMQSLIQMMGNLSRRIDYLSEDSWKYVSNHGKGHLPPIKTAAQMEKALKSCGMDGDYSVEKPSIFVSASAKKGLQITASYTKPK